MRWRDGHELERRQERRLSWPQVRKDQTTGFDARIRSMANPLVEPAPGRFAGLLAAFPIDVVEPAVVDAPQSAVFNAAIAQVGPAMRTVDRNQPRASPVISKE